MKKVIKNTVKLEYGFIQELLNHITERLLCFDFTFMT